MIEEIFAEGNEFHRDALEIRLERAQFGQENIYNAGDLADPIAPYRARLAGESLREYKEIEYLYYQGTLETRWEKYFKTLDKEMMGRYEYGGLSDVVNKTNLGFFDIPEELVQYDLYDIQSNAAMNELLALGIPIDAKAQQMALYLESSAFRAAGRSSRYLVAEVVNPSVYNMVDAAMQANLTIPGFGRQDFINLMSPVMSEARALMIAKTEATRARNHATEELADAMRNQGYQLTERWAIAMNTNVCPECEELDGTVRGVSWTDYPPLHPNCDCDVLIEMLEVEVG